MCGIAGILSFDNKVDLDSLKKMTNAIAHRGPDGEGHWINNSVVLGFGHRRLSIIDLSDTGKQPMHYADGRYTITFNGEIYNYLEIREELQKKGYHFTSRSDTEVLLAIYDLKKEKCLQELDGMFAFSIWDEKEQSLFCARDRFGEKPFYYSYQPESKFCFASEMKALWALGISKENDEETLNNYLQTASVINTADINRTFYKHVRQLDASHFLTIKDKKITIVRYYDIDISIRNMDINETEAAEKFRTLFKESVRLRMRSDVPVGSSLSGGLDSSSIVMMMDTLKSDSVNQNTFSARFEGFDKDEGKYIHKVVQSCKNLTCHEVWPGGEQMAEDIDKLAYHQEEPFASASIYAQWKVMELARQKGVIVLQDGQGADEYLAGYLPYYGLYLKQLFFTDKKKYKHEWKACNELRQGTIKKVEEQETTRMKLGRMKKKILNQSMPYDKNSLSQELKKHATHVGLKELLRYADRNSMAHSREVRLPFLSHKLIEFAFSLPDSYKLQNGWTKYILRRSMESILPAEICWRVDKIGYEPPQNKWLSESPLLKKQIASGEAKYNHLTGSKNGTANEWMYLMVDKYANI